MNSIYRTAGYATEFARYRRHVLADLTEILPNADTQSVLSVYSATTAAGAATVTKQIFDLAHPGEAERGPKRQRAAEIGMLSLVLTDIIDDQLDTLGVEPEDMTHYFDRGMAAMFRGERVGDTLDDTNSNVIARASFDIAAHLHESVFQHDEKGVFEEVFKKLTRDVIGQAACQDLKKQLEYTIDVGASCAAVSHASVEFVDDREYPQVGEAARRIGAYAQLLDNAADIAQDIEEGSLTYATLFLSEQGDTPKNRKQARDDLLDVASDSYRQGREVLDTRQQPIYDSIRHMVDTKYRLVKPVKSTIKRALGTSRKAPEYSAMMEQGRRIHEMANENSSLHKPLSPLRSIA